MSSEPRVLTGEFDGFCWIRVEGNGTVANSPKVKAAGNQAISHGLKKLVVDLEECPMMDSTFMGTLTGLAIKVEESGGEGVEVVHLSERTLELLEELGLNHLLDIDFDGGHWTDRIGMIREGLSELGDLVPEGKIERAHLMLDAHERLAEVGEENEEKFGDVVEMLRKRTSGGDLRP